jgi:hypothetical protein
MTSYDVPPARRLEVPVLDQGPPQLPSGVEHRTQQIACLCLLFGSWARVFTLQRVLPVRFRQYPGLPPRIHAVPPVDRPSARLNERGEVGLRSGRSVAHAEAPTVEVVSTVGAGDAFCATLPGGETVSCSALVSDSSSAGS